MHTRPGSEVLNQDRREFLTTTATGIAAAGMASLFPACPAPAETNDAIRPFRVRDRPEPGGAHAARRNGRRARRSATA